MKLSVAALVLFVADGAAVAVMLAIRRRAPSGSYFHDTTQASGVFAVAGTTFAVLVAFVFLLAFGGYDSARNSAEDETTAVVSLFHTAEFFSPQSRDRLQADLVCYSRSVIHEEWPALRHGERSPVTTAWTTTLERDFQRVRAPTVEAQAALANWFEQTDARQKARQGRVSQAAPFVPTVIWFFLLVGGALVVAFVLFFADRSERHVAQAMLITVVTTFAVASLLMVYILDNPYRGYSGSVEPTSLRETLRVLEAERHARHTDLSTSCDVQGRPLATSAAA
jgi:hypothetical protein